MNLPEQAAGYGISVRRWRRADVDVLHAAIVASVEHLRPWMEWAEDEPRTVEEHLELLGRWEDDWDRAADAHFAVCDEQGGVVGVTGLHHRQGPGVLEIGYWTHAAHLRRGFASRGARLVTDLAFTLPTTDYVEIHHDQANNASRGVPLRLGYEFFGERPDDRAAPAEVGIDCTWRVSREVWLAARSDELSRGRSD